MFAQYVVVTEVMKLWLCPLHFETCRGPSPLLALVLYHVTNIEQMRGKKSRVKASVWLYVGRTKSVFYTAAESMYSLKLILDNCV